MTRQPGSYQGPGEAPGSDSDYAFDGWVPTNVRGRLTEQAPLDKLVWFKSGGAADWLFEPADLDDLVAFVEAGHEGDEGGISYLHDVVGQQHGQSDAQGEDPDNAYGRLQEG